MPAHKQLWEKRMGENCTPIYVDAFPQEGRLVSKSSALSPENRHGSLFGCYLLNFSITSL